MKLLKYEHENKSSFIVYESTSKTLTERYRKNLYLYNLQNHRSSIMHFTDKGFKHIFSLKCSLWQEIPRQTKQFVNG